MPDIKPLVSIIIPTFNRANLIEETLQSVKAQTYFNWECVVVDDGSTDNTIEIISQFSKSENRIQLFNRNGSTKGAPTCRNIGIEKSKGDFIIFLDSDDLMADFCLERRVRLFKEYPENDFLVFQSLLFEMKLNDKNILWNNSNSEDDLRRFLRTDALWPICGPIYKKEVLKKLGGFREDLSFWQDFDLHLRCLLLKSRYKKFLSTEPDFFIRHHFNDSVSRSISFTGDPKILQQRIYFYFSQIEFTKENRIKLTSEQKLIIWNVLYFFCRCYIHEHHNKWMFTKNWMKTGKLLEINPFKHFVALTFPFLESLCKTFPFFIKFKTVYQHLFKNQLADPNVIFRSTMQQIKYTPQTELS